MLSYIIQVKAEKNNFFSLMWVSGQLARTSINPTGPEVNDHVSLQWPSYEQPQSSNLRPQREQISWSQTLITRSPPRWFKADKLTVEIMGHEQSESPREFHHLFY